jgi:hypothetical protein
MLFAGTKVYLSKWNVVTAWLTRNQIKVYIFEEDFIRDVEQNNVVLDDVTAQANRNGIIALLEHNHNQQTMKSLEEEILKNRQINIK